MSMAHGTCPCSEYKAMFVCSWHMAMFREHGHVRCTWPCSERMAMSFEHGHVFQRMSTCSNVRPRPTHASANANVPQPISKPLWRAGFLTNKDHVTVNLQEILI